uniref:Uncharacterized protein n=1 Tax=viral metagenome TaxID=1070528 RepID=A0A6C0B7V9_9ZZZZ
MPVGPTLPFIPSISSNIIFYILIIIIFAIIYLIWIKPYNNIVQNAKDIYQSSLNTINITYGSPKKEAEQAAQTALDTWNIFLTKIYKIIIESLLIISGVLFNYYKGSMNTFSIGVNLLILGTMLFEYFSDILDNWLKSKLNDINASASKNTEDNTGEHHKSLALFISGLMCLASVLGKIKYGDSVFITSGVVSFVLSMLTLFNANFNSTAALICFSIIGILSIFAAVRYDNQLFYASFVISAIISVMSAFNISSFDSEPYIFILFFLANIPFVTLFMYNINLQNSKDTAIYIPLLIAFYMLSIIILSIIGTVDLSLNTNLFVIVSIIGFSILNYAKSLQDSIYKTFLLVVAMIIFFFIALHYILVSQQWIFYMIAFIGIMYMIMKRSPSTVKSINQNSKVTNKEIVLISGEILFILTYIYIRSIAKKVYTKHGQLIVNNPVSLHELKVVKIDETINYDYGLSFWVYIDAMNPSSSPQANEYTTIISYGDAPRVSYNSTLNTMKITIKTESKKIKSVDEIKSLPLQKWNHIVLNYLNGTCDVFVNSELHATKIEVIPVKESEKIFEIGTQDGIQGKVCNVIFFQEHLNSSKIKELYNEFSYKNPPTI